MSWFGLWIFTDIVNFYMHSLRVQFLTFTILCNNILYAKPSILRSSYLCSFYPFLPPSSLWGPIVLLNILLHNTVKPLLSFCTENQLLHPQNSKQIKLYIFCIIRYDSEIIGNKPSSKLIYFAFCRVMVAINVGRDSSVSIVTHYGLDGPGIESR